MLDEPPPTQSRYTQELANTCYRHTLHLCEVHLEIFKGGCSISLDAGHPGPVHAPQEELAGPATREGAAPRSWAGGPGSLCGEP